MEEMKLRFLFLFVALVFIATVPASGEPWFLLDSELEWAEGLTGGNIYPMGPPEWQGDYMPQWGAFLEEGEPYPTDTEFVTPGLYEWGGGGSGGLEPNDAGLVMYWGAPDMNDANYCAAFKYDYLLDPDLTNCTITVTVTAPQFTPGGPSQITQVSLGLQDSLTAATPGAIRSWYWNVGPLPAPIQWNTPTTVTIDLSKTGLTAATPAATGYMSNPGFSLKTVQYIIVDENGQWVGGLQPAPPPGGVIAGMWNYWHNLSVTQNVGGGGSEAVNSKWHIKWSQPPTIIDPDANPPLIWGWDELSHHDGPNMVADDWLCKDDRPVTDIHWWGSFIGWRQPTLPPIRPKGFHIGIWTDVPVSANNKFSHPGEMIWDNYCTNWVWNFAGYDVDPQERPEREMEACFQFTQLLSQDEWFHQEPNEDAAVGTVYWLSIAADYDPADYDNADFYPWGWKTRRHHFNDDAVTIWSLVDPTGAPSWPGGPLGIGVQWNDSAADPGPGEPITWPTEDESWDLAFELTTNEGLDADLNADGIVNFIDFATFADMWLMVIPIP
ncbi:MAG: hypothetical protein MUO22_08370 [Sedimentisphaerales bacterium]|nr:hypothetical protein [Sedimentisphaerales bacterium]